jgi:zinc transport system permease protein
MIEILSYDFMQNALISGILVSLAAGIIGSLILVNRMVFLAGGIAHTSYGGTMRFSPCSKTKYLSKSIK